MLMSVITYLNIFTLLVCVLIWICLIAFRRLRKKKSFLDLTYLTLFFVYVVKVLDYTLFQFQSLLLLKVFMPKLMLNGQAAGKTLNLIPLITLSSQDLKTSLLNILMLVLFGFGLPFVTNFRMKKVVVSGFLFSVAIELLQYLTGVLAKMTFRIADINDVIFNTVGVVIGYLLFVGFQRVFRVKMKNIA